MNRLFVFSTCLMLSAFFLNSTANGSSAFVTIPITSFEEAWAMSFLPDKRLLITEKKGRLLIVTQSGDKSEPLTGVPDVDYGGQGGFGDIVLHPEFASNRLVYISYVEAGEDDTRGAVVARAKLILDNNGGGQLENLQIIWHQYPKVTGRGHFGHRIAFSPDGYLFISSGERQKFDPAQDMKQNLGKILRLHHDGSVPNDNPFSYQGGIAAQIWTLGHRNPLGIAFDSQDRLWNIEMGPKGGDEINLIIRGENYGYPIVSNGNHYNGKKIPDHDTQTEFAKPKIWWTPVISPSEILFYSGNLFPEWKGNAFITGLSSKSLVRITFDGDSASEAERFDMKKRIRAVKQGPNGAIWLLEDRSGGRLLKLIPERS